MRKGRGNRVCKGGRKAKNHVLPKEITIRGNRNVIDTEEG